MKQTVWVIVKNLPICQRQESGDTLYNEEIQEVFIDAVLAKHTYDFLMHHSKQNNDRVLWSLHEYPIVDEPSSELVAFIRRQMRREEIMFEIEGHQRKIEQLRSELEA